VRGQVDRAGLKSRPAVPPRARASSSIVGNKLAVDGVGDPAFEAAHGFGAGLACGEFAPVEGAAIGVQADLGGSGDVGCDN
jgi:hypothetical protein